MNQQIQIYKDPEGNTQIEVQFENETVWLNQSQMVQLFNSSKANISEHLKQIFDSEELDRKATVRKTRTVQKEGTRSVSRLIDYFNLEVIISVGYRVNTKSGIQFRRWATSRLKDLLVNGYTLNEKRLAKKNQEVKVLKSGIQILSRAIENKAQEEGMDWLDIYAKGLEILDDYDHEALDKKGKTKRKATYPALVDYQQLVKVMRKEFDSDVFGKEKDQNFRSSIAQIEKGMGDTDFYPTLEEKAAMLLYLVTKNHSFVDGNKRIAAACFLYFLDVNRLMYNKYGEPILSNEALASLTLLVASSKPEEMETIRRLIVSVLNRNNS